MTKEEAIKHLETYSTTNGSGQTTQAQHEEAKRMAIKALEQEPNIFFNPNPEYEELFGKIEDALGFKLYAWTKSYIIQGKFRCYGKTTAEILRTLVTDVDKEPIVVPPQSGMHMNERFYYKELSDIYERLSIAGIPTRNVIFKRR